MKMRIYRDRSGEWRWSLRAENGRRVADSGEGYKTKRGVIQAVRRLIGVATGSNLSDVAVASLTAFEAPAGGDRGRA